MLYFDYCVASMLVIDACRWGWVIVGRGVCLCVPALTPCLLDAVAALEVGC